MLEILLNIICKSFHLRLLLTQDADEILKMDPSNVRGLVWKAESQYNLANFEHSLKYFHRYG